MTHQQRSIWGERLLLAAILVSLAVTLHVVITVQRAASKPPKDAISQPAPSDEATGLVAGAISPVATPTKQAVVTVKQNPSLPPPLPELAPPEDPTKKALVSLTTAMAAELAAAGQADRRSADLDKARLASEADTKRWKRREFLVRQQISTLTQQAEQLEGESSQIASERDVLAQERDALKAALTNVKRQGSYAVLPYKGSNGTWRRPIVIECSDNAVQLKPDGPAFSMLDLSPFLNPRANPLVLAVARQLLHIERAETPDGAPAVPYLVFLVRPSGIRTYYEARDRLEPLGIAFGYELIDQDLVVDVPDFDNVATWDGSAPEVLPIVAAPAPKAGVTLPSRRSGSSPIGPAEAPGLRRIDTPAPSPFGPGLAMRPDAAPVADFVWPSHSGSSNQGRVGLPGQSPGSANPGGTASPSANGTLADRGQSNQTARPRSATGSDPADPNAISRSISNWTSARQLAATPGGNPNAGSLPAGAPAPLGDTSTDGPAAASSPRMANNSNFANNTSGSSQPGDLGRSPAGSASVSDRFGTYPGNVGNSPSTQPGTSSNATGADLLPDFERAGDSPAPSASSGSQPALGGQPGSRQLAANPLASNDSSLPPLPPTGSSNLASPTNNPEQSLVPLGSLSPAIANAASPPAGSSDSQPPANPPSPSAIAAAKALASLSNFKPTAPPSSSSSSSSNDPPVQFSGSTPANSTPDSLGSLFSRTTTTTPGAETFSASPSSSASGSSSSTASQNSSSASNSSPPSGIGLPSFSLNQQQDSSNDNQSPFNLQPPPIVPRPSGSIDVQFQIVLVCRQNDVLVHPGGYTLSTQALKEQGGGSDSLLARELRAILRRQANIDPMIRPKPSIKYLVETNGANTFWTARKLLLFSGLDWPTTLEVAGAQQPSFLTGGSR